MRGAADAHRAIVLSAFRKGPASAEQISERLGNSLNTLQVMKRISELIDNRMVEETGTVAVNRSGRAARVYKLACSAPVVAHTHQHVEAEDRPGDLALPPDPSSNSRRWKR
jgi:predicted ArsR family transcriptional regulator